MTSFVRLCARRALATRLPRVLSSLHHARNISLLTVQSNGNTALRACPFKVSTRWFSDLPEHEVLGMPALSPTMEQGNIVEWSVKEGDTVGPGDALCEIETDKATVTFESTEEGVIVKILKPNGTAGVAVGTPIAVLAEEGTDPSVFSSFEPSGTPTPAATQQEEQAPPAPTPTPAPAHTPAHTTPAPAQAAPATPAPQPQGGRILASPLAKRLAAEAGIDLSALTASGPGGRIVAKDVVSPPAFSAPPSAVSQSGSFVDEPVSNIRKVIANRLLESKTTIPHYYLTVDCRVDELMALRSRLNKATNGEPKLSLNDFVIKASALALRKVPDVNSSWMGDSIRRYNYVDISVAVATENGLITPIVADADTKGVAGISSTVKDLAERARDNKLKPEEFQGGTFTISNLGMFGVKQFAAIINPPQACILAVGSLDKRVVPSSDGDSTENATMMSVTLSCDHRVVDGAVGAQWLAEFKRHLEQPETMLL